MSFQNKSYWPLVHAYHFSQIFLDGDTNDFYLTKNHDDENMLYHLL